MKAVISSTYNDKYLYFLPIITYCWNRLGVDVICFMPRFGYEKEDKSDDKWLNQSSLVHTTMRELGMKWDCHYFDAPKHKEATYAQVSRLYGACLDLPEDEVLFTSDVDMALFKLPPYIGGFTVLGHDLVPQGQFPICYISAKVKDWRRAFNLRDFTYQQCLDGILGEIEAQHFRGNYWGKDQEEAYLRISSSSALVDVNLVDRARPGTQFATNRIDRDDSFWRERLSPDIIDAHLWRPGYTDENFPKILELLQYFYPNEDFTWLIDYTDQYKKLL